MNALEWSYGKEELGMVEFNGVWRRPRQSDEARAARGELGLGKSISGYRVSPQIRGRWRWSPKLTGEGDRAAAVHDRTWGRRA